MSNAKVNTCMYDLEKKKKNDFSLDITLGRQRTERSKQEN
jgi:hypothetical protein